MAEGIDRRELLAQLQRLWLLWGRGFGPAVGQRELAGGSCWRSCSQNQHLSISQAWQQPAVGQGRAEVGAAAGGTHQPHSSPLPLAGCTHETPLAWMQLPGPPTRCQASAHLSNHPSARARAPPPCRLHAPTSPAWTRRWLAGWQPATSSRSEPWRAARTRPCRQHSRLCPGAAASLALLHSRKRKEKKRLRGQ